MPAWDREDPVYAVIEAAEEGVAFDGLHVEATGDGYAFYTPAFSRTDIDEPQLRGSAYQFYGLVSNWYFWERVVEDHGTARRAFLRWLEEDFDPVVDAMAAAGEGLTSHWGQLAVTVRLGPSGERRYELRHVDDLETAASDLDGRDPAALRSLVKTDDAGRYRPLRSAPSLPTGWVVDGLAYDEVVPAVQDVYPATVANWHRERAGELDVTHYAEAAGRQTGIYDVVDQLDPDHVADLARTCCVDSQCLKRREWAYDEGESLDVPGGDGEFPCREPCSVALTAARKFVTLERETPREYAMELTPTEKEQLEGILDAVAEDRLDEIREADLNEPANRYRVRWLRERRVGEHGLGGAPTYPAEVESDAGGRTADGDDHGTEDTDAGGNDA